MTILIVLAGAAFSFIGTLVGLGGGVFMVPLLVLAVGYPLPMAVGSVALRVPGRWGQYQREKLQGYVPAERQTPR